MKKVGLALGLVRPLLPYLPKLLLGGLVAVLAWIAWQWYQQWFMSARALLVLACCAAATLIASRLRATGKVPVHWVVAIYMPAAVAYLGVVSGISREREIFPAYIAEPSIILALLTLPVWIYFRLSFRVKQPPTKPRPTTENPEVLNGGQWLRRQFSRGGDQ